MKKTLSTASFEIISTVFAMILGTLLHFSYEWTNGNPFVGIFSAVNESTWEHLKILFFPMLLTTIIGYFYNKDIPNYMCYKSKGILLSLLFIVVFFYTYVGIIGNNLAVLDISSFYVAIILGEYYTLKQINNNANCNSNFTFITFILLICFIVFTFYPPDIGIFRDPIVSTFNIF